jgi:fluoride exporter
VKTLLYVVLGGGIGTGLRFGLNLLLKPETNTVFPIHTFVINAIGCLLMGIVFAYFLKQTAHNPLMLTVVTTGILGGFTTFSAYAIESIQLFEARKGLIAITYIAASNLVGLIAAWLGYNLYKLIN